MFSRDVTNLEVGHIGDIDFFVSLVNFVYLCTFRHLNLKIVWLTTVEWLVVTIGRTERHIYNIIDFRKWLKIKVKIVGSYRKREDACGWHACNKILVEKMFKIYIADFSIVSTFDMNMQEHKCILEPMK